MKKSVWYHKLWRKKVAELPVNDDLDKAWQQMNNLLDQHFNLVNPKETTLPKGTLLQHFTQIIKLILPTMLVAGVIYFAFYQKTEVENQEKVMKQKPFKAEQEMQHLEDLIMVDSDDTKASADKIQRKGIEENDILSKTKMIKSSLKTETSNQKDSAKGAITTIISLEKIEGQTMSDKFNVNSSNLPSYSRNTIGVRTNHSIELLLKLNHVRPLTVGKEQQLTQSSVLSKRQQRRLKRALTRDSLAKAKDMQERQRAALKPMKVKPKKDIKEIVSPKFSYELQAGLMFGKQNTSPYLGIQSQWTLTNRWLLGTGLRFNQVKLNGEYFHQGYNTVTTGSPFQIVDSRKLTNMVLPLNISYRLNKWMSLKADANLTFAIAQNGGGKVGHVVSYLDTVFHTKQIEQALSETNVNKLHFNIGGGASIQFKRFSIEAMYFYQVTPYRVSSSLGAYQRRYITFNIGLGYRF